MTKRSLNLQQDSENKPQNVDISSPPAKKSTLSSQQPRPSVIKVAGNGEKDLLQMEHQEMGVQRLQSQTPVKSSGIDFPVLMPLQDVPLNLTSPPRPHQENGNELPVPRIFPNLTNIDVVPRTNSAEQLLSLQSLQGTTLLHATPPHHSKAQKQVGSYVYDAHVDNLSTPPRRMQSKAPGEEQDTLLGALALVELSQSPQ